MSLQHSKSVNREILTLAVPFIITNIANPLMGLVDTGIAGHLGQEAHQAAIGVGANIMNMIYWLFGFLRMGTVGETAQAYGRGDSRAMSATLWRGWLAAFTIGIAIALLHNPIANIALKFMGSSPQVNLLATQYLDIVLWGAPAVMMTYVVTGWLPGMQSAAKPMTIALTVNILNVVLSPLLAVKMGLGIKGLAIGTLASQLAGIMLGTIMCLRYRLKVPALSIILNGKEIKRFFSINTDIFLRTLCLIAVTAWFTRAGARLGDTILAVNSILMQLFLLFSYFTDGFAYAAEALTGRFIGAGDRHALKRCIKHLLAWGGAIALLFTVIYAVAGDACIAVLSDKEGIRQVAHDFVPWIATVPLAGFMAFTWDGIFVGATATRGMLVSILIATVLYFAIYAVLSPLWGNHALWLAFIAYLLTRGIVQHILWKRRYML